VGSLFVVVLECVLTASYLPKDQKAPYVLRAITKLDALKFFLKIAWEIKALDTKYLHV
jgi:hypothetical protein